jgi:hypothetical protein
MPSLPHDDVDVYIVIADFGTNGRSFLETDVAQADRATIVSNMISGEYRDPLRVVAFNTVEGWSRDLSEEIAGSKSVRYRSEGCAARRRPKRLDTQTGRHRWRQPLH